MGFIRSFLTDSKMFESLVVVESALYKSGYNLNLSESAFRQKLSELGINQEKLNEIIYRIEKKLNAKIKAENKLVIENAYDLITMVYSR